MPDVNQGSYKEAKTEQLIELLTTEIAERLLVNVETSGRHLHLSQQDLEGLFGKGYLLTIAKELSQPGQYACQERVSVCGPKGELKNVVVLGPCRRQTQIEVSLSDCITLGVKAPIRESGNVQKSSGITIKANGNSLVLDEGLIVAQRHLHITPAEAKKFDLQDKELIKLKMFTKRPLVFDDVLVRISPSAHTIVHLDYDEGNACAFETGDKALILKKSVY